MTTKSEPNAPERIWIRGWMGMRLYFLEPQDTPTATEYIRVLPTAGTEVSELAREAAKRITRQITNTEFDWASLAGARGDSDFIAGEKALIKIATIISSVFARSQKMAVNEAKGVDSSVVIPEDSSESADGPNSACALCGGPHDFDTSVPSAVWNRVIRAKGLPEYLCTTCIVREFVRAGEGFTAQLWNEEFYGTTIEVVIDGKNANDAALVSDENTAYRVRIEELENVIKGLGDVIDGRTTSIEEVRRSLAARNSITQDSGTASGLSQHVPDHSSSSLCPKCQQEGNDLGKWFECEPCNWEWGYREPEVSESIQATLAEIRDRRDKANRQRFTGSHSNYPRWGDIDLLLSIIDSLTRSIPKAETAHWYAPESCPMCWHVLCKCCFVNPSTQGRVLKCCKCQYQTDYQRLPCAVCSHDLGVGVFGVCIALDCFCKCAFLSASSAPSAEPVQNQEERK